jgi:hypothetical protein
MEPIMNTALLEIAAAKQNFAALIQCAATCASEAGRASINALHSRIYRLSGEVFSSGAWVQA